jgi:hypothetical protein
LLNSSERRPLGVSGNGDQIGWKAAVGAAASDWRRACVMN